MPALEDYLETEVGEARYQDLHLQTRLTAEQLDTQLLRIDNDAHTLLNEQGIEVLYLALGFLEWYEDPNASTPRYAPCRYNLAASQHDRDLHSTTRRLI